jgi:hypothetical protein
MDVDFSEQQDEDEKVKEVVASYGFGAELSAERTVFGWVIKTNKGEVAAELQGLWSDFDRAKQAIHNYVMGRSYAYRVEEEEKAKEAVEKAKPKKAK